MNRISTPGYRIRPRLGATLRQCLFKLMSFGVHSTAKSDARTPLLQEELNASASDKLADAYHKETGTPREFEQRQNKLCDAVAAAWKIIVDLTRRVLCRVAALLAVIFPFKQQSLTDKQEERLRALWWRCQIPFDSNSKEHVDALKALWHATFPDAPWNGQRSTKWTEMGWQGMDPATDFRGGGFLALESLLDLYRLRPVLFKKLMYKSEGVRAEWEYPFAVAGVNLTFTLTEILQLRSPSQAKNTSHVRGFLRLLDVEENLFSHLFCIMFALLDKTWLDMKATYMEFPLVMKKTRQKMEEALGHQPRNLSELKRLLAL